MIVKPITANLWEIRADEGGPVLGMVRRVNAGTETKFISQPDSQGQPAWRKWDYFDDAAAALRPVAAAPESSQDAPAEPAPDVGSRFGLLEVD